MDPLLQAKLLQVLQDEEFYRVGGKRPLRERKEDIAPLVRHFVEKYRRRYKGGLDRVPDDVMERFHAYDWPGNVRELENLVRRLVVLKEPSMVLGELNAARNVQASAPRLGAPNTAIAAPS